MALQRLSRVLVRLAGDVDRHPGAREVGDELLQVGGVLEQAAVASVHNREVAVGVATLGERAILLLAPSSRWTTIESLDSLPM